MPRHTHRARRPLRGGLATAKAAIKQCCDRNYAVAFADGLRPVYYVGVNYSPRQNQRTINDVACEKA